MPVCFLPRGVVHRQAEGEHAQRHVVVEGVLHVEGVRDIASENEGGPLGGANHHDSFKQRMRVCILLGG